MTGPTRETETLSLPLRVADLPGRGGVAFRLQPDAAARAALAGELGVQKIRKLTFQGTLEPDGRHDLRLEGVLGATVVQDCVITGAPVTTRIDTAVVRRFLRRMPEPSGPETEIPEDDTLEPLGAEVDPGAVMAEALSLALPDYPRAEGAELPDSVADDAEAPRNPFAVLAALKPQKDADGE